MPSRIKFPIFKHTSLSNLKSFVGYWCMLANFVGESFLKLNNIFTMLFFDNQIRQHLFTQVTKSISGSYPRMDSSFVRFFRRPSVSSGVKTFKCVDNPVYENLFSVINFQTTPMMSRNFSFVASICLSNMKATFSVNDSSHIGQMQWIVLLWNVLFGSAVVFFSWYLHDLSFRDHYNNIIDHCKLLQAERLNERDPMFSRICESLISTTKGREGESKNFPRQVILLGHKK